MTKQAQLPESLYDAYEWTDAAGELDELRTTRAWRRYVFDASVNARAHGYPEITMDALIALRQWLRQEANS